MVVERVEHRARFADVLRVLGLGRPGLRALAVALVVSGLVLTVFPLTTAVSGAGCLLTCRAAVFRTGAQESRAFFGPPGRGNVSLICGNRLCSVFVAVAV